MWGVPIDSESAATLWPVVRERGHEDEAARPNGTAHLGNVACPIGRCGEKVEDGPVMPDGISGLRKRGVQNIGLEIAIADVQEVIDQS